MFTLLIALYAFLINPNGFFGVTPSPRIDFLLLQILIYLEKMGDFLLAMGIDITDVVAFLPNDSADHLDLARQSTTISNITSGDDETNNKAKSA